jgi:nucleotide-binding universal stress UspA family protein
MDILVTLNRSWFSEAVLGPATQMAAGAGAVLHLLTVIGLEEPSADRFHRAGSCAVARPPVRRAHAGPTRSGELETRTNRLSSLSQAAIAIPTKQEVASHNGKASPVALHLERLQHEARSHLAIVTQRWYQVPVTREVVVSDSPAAAILDHLDAHPAELLAMATQARGCLTRPSAGSVAGAVMSTSTSPVLLVGLRFHEGGIKKFRSLLVYLDGSSAGESILPAAGFWARALGLHVTLIRAARSETSSIKRAAGYLEELTLGLALGGLAARWELIYGDPAWEITGRAAQCSGAMIAMSTHGEGGLTHAAVGMVAAQTLRLATCPMLLQRPAPPFQAERLIGC